VSNRARLAEPAALWSEVTQASAISRSVQEVVDDRGFMTLSSKLPNEHTMYGDVLPHDLGGDHGQVYVWVGVTSRA